MRVVLTIALMILAAPVLTVQAKAFDFFGLFGSEEPLPAPSPQSVPYDVQLSGIDDKTLLQNLRDVSNTWQLRRDPPPTGDGVVRRAVADIPRFAEALWAAGYYNADVRITVAGRRLDADTETGNAGAARAAEAERGRALVPVVVEIVPEINSSCARSASSTPGPMRRCRPISCPGVRR